MVDRKRRNARPSLEPMEGRALLSGLLVALQAPVPQISPSQEVTIASNLSTSSKTGQVSAKATTNASGLYIGAEGPNAAAGSYPASPISGSGTPTAAELAREKFVAKFSGP